MPKPEAVPLAGGQPVTAEDFREPTFDDSDGFDVDSVVAQYAEQLINQEAAQAEEEAPAEEAPEEAPQEEPVKAEKPPAPEPEPDLTSRQLSALAEREAALLARERALKEREAQPPKEPEPAKPDPAETLAKLRKDPLAALKELGLDPAHIAALHYYGELGEDAPEELRAKIQQDSLRAKLEDIERQVAERGKEADSVSQKAALAARVQIFDNELASFAQEVPESMPYLQKLAADNPADAYQALSMVAAQAIEKGHWPSTREVARHLEDSLKREIERFHPPVQSKTASEDTEAPEQGTERKPTKTLSDADTTVGKQHLDPDEVQDDDFYIQRGIAVARKYGLG